MRILLFAHLKSIVGQSQLELNLPQNFRSEELWTQILAACPALRELRPTIRVARNCEFADDQTQFQNSDEIALIPPVSGG